MRKKKAFFLFVCLAGFLGASQAWAKSSYLTQFNSKYSTSGTALNSCNLCHTRTPSVNAFGSDFANPSIGNHTYNSALEARDSDGDGFSNLSEINARTFPGDPSSKPATDTTSPTVTSFTIPSTSTSLTVAITSFTATDNVGVTGYGLSESGSTPPSGWSGSVPSSYTFSSAGTKTLYAWAKDAAGNISSPKSAQVTITIPPPPPAPDTSPPVVTAFSMPSTSSSLTVPVTSFAATDNVGVTGYGLSESGSTPPSGWSGSAPSSYTFSSAGTKTLYAWAKDAAGNISSPKSAQVSITLNPNPPPAPNPEPSPIPSEAVEAWVDGWIRLTIFLKKGHGWSELGLQGEERKLTGYLHLAHWDPETQVLGGLLYWESETEDEDHGLWVLPLDFLILSTGKEELWATSQFTDDPSTTFTARFKGKLVKEGLKPGILQSKHKQEAPESKRWFWLKGKLIPESQVPQQILDLASTQEFFLLNQGGDFD